jgi:hypothetical protein
MEEVITYGDALARARLHFGEPVLLGEEGAELPQDVEGQDTPVRLLQVKSPWQCNGTRKPLVHWTIFVVDDEGLMTETTPPLQGPRRARRRALRAGPPQPNPQSQRKEVGNA